ncbi:proteoglycan 4-like isoform X2 [Denticeps clupeoides]|uniref:proteoglycan 4-like isoform X2 n=1 Tax=Denticeps clupeoides TaxID=299321 RepID=UPI0010A3FB5F|nr:proteoglycan 4-like isoform X2 [Denticeps clupeoides]
MTMSPLRLCLLLLSCHMLPFFTAQASCVGRCGEPFSRGQLCNCDDNCLAHDECCKDFEAVCTSKNSNQFLPSILLPHQPSQKSPGDGPILPSSCMVVCPDVLPPAGFQAPAQSASGANSPGESPRSPRGSEAAMTQDQAAQPGMSGSGMPMSIPIQVSFSLGTNSAGNAKPGNLEDQSGQNAELCSDQPIDGLIALRNGSILVFKGHHFWVLDPKTRASGQTRGITDELGIPSPIDTAFTRCNCEGKTYIIKGDSYWRLANGVVEPGYPRSLSADFGGLKGDITAVLPVPATRKRPEALYFFRKGNMVQKLTYPPGSNTSCGKKGKNPPSNGKNSKGHIAEVIVTGEINMKLSWKGFPTPVTAAVSIPTPKKPDGYDYFIFSGPKFFSVKIGDGPMMASPASSQQNQIKDFLKCP